MLRDFVNHVNRQHLFPTGREVLLAVSGGLDSSVLASLMHRAAFPFAVAHCNFHLRPGDCDRDESFVRALAESYGASFHVAHFDTSSYAAAHGLGIEDAARRLRYEWFASLCHTHSYPALLTAHHAGDSAETFFLNLLRGTGLAGLHGILPNVRYSISDFQFSIVRPLLPFSRVDIEAYAVRHGLQHVEDTTNASLLYRRNQVRHQVLPLLREVTPSADAAIGQTVSHLQSVERLYRHLLAPLRERYVLPHPGGSLRLALSCLLADFPTDLHCQLLFELLHPLGFNASQCEALLASPRSGAQFLTATHHAVVHRGDLIIDETPATPLQGFPPLAQFSTLAYPVAELPSDFKTRSATTAFFDVATLHLPLSLRHWREGDRFQPLGMEHGSQLVSDFFTDHHVALPDKQRQLLLVDADDTILWLVGRRTSHPHRITPATYQVLQVSILP